MGEFGFLCLYVLHNMYICIGLTTSLDAYDTEPFYLSACKFTLARTVVTVGAFVQVRTVLQYQVDKGLLARE